MSRLDLMEALEEAASIGGLAPVSLETIEAGQETIVALLPGDGEKIDLAYFGLANELILWWSTKSWWSLELPDGIFDLRQPECTWDLAQHISALLPN